MHWLALKLFHACRACLLGCGLLRSTPRPQPPVRLAVAPGANRPVKRAWYQSCSPLPVVFLRAGSVPGRSQNVNKPFLQPYWHRRETRLLPPAAWCRLCFTCLEYTAVLCCAVLCCCLHASRQRLAGPHDCAQVGRRGRGAAAGEPPHQDSELQCLPPLLAPASSPSCELACCPLLLRPAPAHPPDDLASTHAQLSHAAVQWN